MLNEETLKIKLLLDYEISNLYLKSGASTKLISDKTGISISTIKRALYTINDRIDDYQRLLPNFLTRDDLEQKALEIQELMDENKRTNRWTLRELSEEVFGEEIKRIKELKKDFDRHNTITNEEKKLMVNLRINGDSLREISKKTGRSLSTVHTKIDKKGKTK